MPPPGCRRSVDHLIDDCIGHVDLEALQTHDALFQAVPHEQAVDVHRSFLAQPMSAVHGLHLKILQTVIVRHGDSED